MGQGAVIGALRGVLVLDTGDWSPAVNRARGDLSGLRGAFEQVGRSVDVLGAKTRNLGIALTAGVTAPLTAMAVASNRTASGFEASMKRVEAALKGVTGQELKQLSDQARSLGPNVGKGATEAADGIEALGLAGLSTADILGGGLKASLDLAAAGAAPVSDAAALVTDAMGQFKVTAAQLPQVVGDVVGALDASKFGFVDFQDALAQGGGVAASAGVDFRDFATAIAATSTQFSSGSDAGTSFKTYIQSLVPVSKEAEFAMKKLGIEFFDVRTGRMKPLAEQAEVLRKAFAGLSDVSKTDALKTIFGSDAARTAIGLMEKGQQGIADLQREIAGGDVGGKIDKRLEGEAAATARVATAFESLKIAIGEAGLTAAMTAIKGAFASVLEAMAHAPPALLKIGVAFGLLAGAIGPLLGILGLFVKYIAVRLATAFGPLTTAISLVLQPLETLMVLFGRAIATRALGAGLSVLVRGLVGLTGPIGLVVAAIVLFKDNILAALSSVYQSAVTRLGPPLQAIFAKLQAMFAQISGGPIGTAVGYLIEAFKALKDAVGTVLTANLMLAGEIIIRVVGAIVAAVSGVVDVIASMVDAVGKLLSGDFAGAWAAVGGAVDAALSAVVAIVEALVPEIGGSLRGAYEAAKTYLNDGFSAVAGFFTTIVANAINWVAGAFPNVVAAAKGVYEGVKGWLVDKFGVLMGWIGNAAKWIGDKYAALKERLGLGGSGGADNSPAPPKPQEVAPPKPVTGTRVVDFTPPKKTRTKKGRDTKYDGENRDQLRAQAELDAARARGDKEAEQRIQDQLALSKQVEAYQRTGLTLDQARAAAQRDMALIQAARTAAAAKEMADERASVALDVARLGSDRQLEDSLERQAELKRRIAFYYEQTKNLAEATRLAEADQAQVDAARAGARARWLADDAQDRALRLAQERGDTEEHIRQLQREVDIRERIRDLQEHGMSAADARAQATAEWSDQDAARQTGAFRETFKDGVRAALDGDLKSFVKDWWKDRVAKGMEEALNSLADLIASLFRRGVSSAGEGGGGLLSGIGDAIGKLFGRGGPAGAGDVDMSGWGDGLGSHSVFVPQFSGVQLPGFATGGSFRVGGMAGIDQNVVAFRATKGEMVDIRRPGNDNGGGTAIHQTIQFSGGVDLATRTEVYRVADAARQAAIAGVADANRRRG